MASSTRRRAIELWQTNIPAGNREKLAQVLFAYENPPGTTVFSGSQDSLGIVLPGLNRLDYRGQYWPQKITPVLAGDTLAWIESCLHLVPLGPSGSGIKVLKCRTNTPAGARALALAADRCWQSILQRDLMGFARWFRRSLFEAQVALFPSMMSSQTRSTIRKYAKSALGWKLSGAGGGGYLVLVNARPMPQTIRLKIRRDSI